MDQWTMLGWFRVNFRHCQLHIISNRINQDQDLCRQRNYVFFNFVTIQQCHWWIHQYVKKDKNIFKRWWGHHEWWRPRLDFWRCVSVNQSFVLHIDVDEKLVTKLRPNLCKILARNSLLGRRGGVTPFKWRRSPKEAVMGTIAIPLWTTLGTFLPAIWTSCMKQAIFVQFLGDGASE